MESIRVGDRIMTRGVGSTAGFLTGVVVEIAFGEKSIIRFLLDEGQSEYGVRAILSRLESQVTKIN